MKGKIGPERFKEIFQTLEPFVEAARAKKPIEEFLAEEKFRIGDIVRVKGETGEWRIDGKLDDRIFLVSHPDRLHTREALLSEIESASRPGSGNPGNPEKLAKQWEPIEKEKTEEILPGVKFIIRTVPGDTYYSNDLRLEGSYARFKPVLWKKHGEFFTPKGVEENILPDDQIIIIEDPLPSEGGGAIDIGVPVLVSLAVAGIAWVGWNLWSAWSEDHR